MCLTIFKDVIPPVVLLQFLFAEAGHQAFLLIMHVICVQFRRFLRSFGGRPVSKCFFCGENNAAWALDLRREVLDSLVSRRAVQVDDTANNNQDQGEEESHKRPQEPILPRVANVLPVDNLGVDSSPDFGVLLPEYLLLVLFTSAGEPEPHSARDTVTHGSQSTALALDRSERDESVLDIVVGLLLNNVVKFGF
jgi:hypothetical protein